MPKRKKAKSASAKVQKKQKRDGFTPKTVKRLFGLSGNECAFPDCHQKLVKEDGTIFGQICHIEAALEGGERYNSKQTPDQRRSFENLILLCANHHIETDNVEVWPVERLKKMKKDHEDKFYKSFFEINDDVARRAIVSSYLDEIARDLDRGCQTVAQAMLERGKELVQSASDPALEFEYDLLQAQMIRARGTNKDIRKEYERLSKLYPEETRPLLLLAEAELDLGDFDENLKLLNKVEAMDPNHWLLAVEKAIRNLRQGTQIDLSTLDESAFPTLNRAASTCYRVYGICFEVAGETAKADQFIEKAIRANPDSLVNYRVKASLLNGRLKRKERGTVTKAELSSLSELIDSTLAKMKMWRTDSERQRLAMLVEMIDILAAESRFADLDKVFSEVKTLSLVVPHDAVVEEALMKLLSRVVGDQDLDALLSHLKSIDENLSEGLVKTLVFQFLIKGQLLGKGKEFFEAIGEKSVTDFIGALVDGDFTGVLQFLGDDSAYTYNMTVALKDFPDIRKALLEWLKTSSDKEGTTLPWVLYHHQNGDHKEAFEAFREIKIDNLDINQLRLCVDVTGEVAAWVDQIELIERLLTLESEPIDLFRSRLNLLNAKFNLGQFLEVISVGSQLLEDPLAPKLLDAQNLEALLARVVMAYLKRGQYQEAIELINSHPKFGFSFQFKVFLEAELYLRSGQKKEALGSVVEGFQACGVPSEEQYGMLFGLSGSFDENDFNFISKDEVQEGNFVRFDNQERWFHFGDGAELDALSVRTTDPRYGVVLGKKVGETVEFSGDKFSGTPPRKIAQIFSLEQYIFWRAREAMNEFARNGSPMIQSIQVLDENGNFDINNVTEFMKSLESDRDGAFEQYCQSPLPFVFLAHQQGGVTNAIGKIVQEQRGFIWLSDGSLAEQAKQDAVAKELISGAQCYLDVTSALFLSEAGLMQEILENIPGLQIPQSVVNFLFDALDKFRTVPGVVGRMGYANGRLTYSQVQEEHLSRARKVLEAALTAIEGHFGSKLAVPKSDLPAEPKIDILDELKDAYLLATETGSAILTDDGLSLRLYGRDAAAEPPKYCSSFALVRALMLTGKLSFGSYLDYFRYLSGYRCRFLPVTTDALMQAVFGSGPISYLEPENIKKFNLPLVMSEEYGVELKVALGVIVQFLSRVIMDDAIPLDASQKIFTLTLTEFLKARKSDRQGVAKLLPLLCRKYLDESQSRSAIVVHASLKDQKLALLDSIALLLGSFKSPE
ncbi:hypothetical protein IPG41_02740 [Candidatus Peregrinibacteria bacterium]|nr:MAG: hypothetical protein IPG41_02740 [Candidatus Peregrinibacteria bacterium]